MYKHGLVNYFGDDDITPIVGETREIADVEDSDFDKIVNEIVNVKLNEMTKVQKKNVECYFCNERYSNRVLNSGHPVCEQCIAQFVYVDVEQ